jgi:dihydroneopterin aldolase
VIAERLMERYGSDMVRVRAAKPEPPLPLSIDEVAVEVVRERSMADDLEGEDAPGSDE